MSFRWLPGAAPPPIEEHSFAKLDVLRLYLRTYLDTLNQDVRRDEFRLDLVDGFAGGGLYSRSGEAVAGSPLVMLEESEDAEQRINQGRHKPLQFDVTYHFVEKNPAHVQFLRTVLEAHGHLRVPGRVHIHERSFHEALDQIISDVKRRQPESGRSIFLLDQCGYTDADIHMVRRIGEQLRNAEVILTVSMDTMLNFATADRLISRLADIGLPRDEKLDVALRKTDLPHRKAVMQRVLPRLVVASTAFRWFTPFFIRPKRSRWELWFVHFSREAKARDVMLECHWRIRNSFAHYGDTFGPEMLGFEALERRQVPLLTFDEGDRREMNATLGRLLMPQLYDKLKANPVPFMGVLNHFGNRTAATSADFNEVVLAARDRRDIQIVGPDGRPRSRSLRVIKPDDAIVLPPQLTLPFSGGTRGRR